MESDDFSDSISGCDNIDDSCDENENDSVEKCILGQKLYNIPELVCTKEEIFNEVVNFDTWENVLTEKQRNHLKKFLPDFTENDEEEKEITIEKLFSDENFKFGAPRTKSFEKLRDGFLTPEVMKADTLLKMANYKEYKNQQHQYFFHLLPQILISRKKLLNGTNLLPPDDPLKMQQFLAKPKHSILCERTRLRYFSILQELREECAEMDTSSEDENYPESVPPKITRKHKKQMQMLEASLSPEMTRITSTTSFPPGYPGSSYFLNRCLDMVEVSEDRYREMLTRHKHKKTLNSQNPEFDVSQVDLDLMVARANLSKRPLLKLSDSQTRKKTKSQESSDKNMKSAMQRSCSPTDLEKLPVLSKLSASDFNPTALVNGDVKDNLLIPVIPEDKQMSSLANYVIKQEIADEILTEIQVPTNYTEELSPTQPVCFFSLLREIFCSAFEQKLSASALEDQVRQWQDALKTPYPDWFRCVESWPDVSLSALKFLAGDFMIVMPESFAPFLDYKEKQQVWQWIGEGRDSDSEMTLYCHIWIQHKDDISMGVLEVCQGSPPPPRVTTFWTVRVSTEKEKMQYREQECVRYQNPHKAFTFKVHGYEAVVGPVKGVYGKESAVNKARGHSLLISDRPPFVTILSLVRDAAARLPNGEGTRADICELLKDSQYLTAASYQQIHTVVSGALDRLHYEKDPCVKYDVNRKLWIYLHRNRTEDEFERIHQAQAAAAKAKKAVQKHKLSTKSRTKDIAHAISTANADAMPDSVAVLLNIDVSSAGTTTTTSPRGGISPRAQASHKPSRQPSKRSRSAHANSTATAQASAKLPQSVILDNPSDSVNSELTQANLLSSALGSTAFNRESPQSSVASNILSQFTSEGNNSRPPSQCSLQSLPSPKTVIANVNAAQFVSVGSLQVGPTSIEQSSASSAMQPCIGVLSMDMKPSSPSFVGQPPVLQPVLSHQTIVTSSPMTTAIGTPLVSSTTAVRASKLQTTSHILADAKTIPTFQTIVLKPDSSGHTTTNLSTLPVLSMEEFSSADSAVLNSNPVVARLLHGSQLVSLGNIVTGTVPSSSIKQGQGTSLHNFKIHSANFGQQVSPASGGMNIFSSQIPSASDMKLPRLALVSQESQDPTLISSAAVGHPAMFPLAQATVRSADTKVTPAHKDFPEVKRITLSSQALGALRPGAPDLTHLIECAQNHVIASSASSSSLPSSITKSSTPVVIAGQDTNLKPLTSTYVMTTPISNASIIAQHGLRPGTSLNVRALQGIKVIPVSQTLAQGKAGIRNVPLLARIISSSNLRAAAVPGELVHHHNLKSGTTMNIIHHGLQPQTLTTSHIVKTTAGNISHEVPPTSQPYIIQVQAPKTSEDDVKL